MWVETAENTIQQVVHQKGLEAMMPGSALTRLLNATPELVSDADLSVIAGDIEAGDGLWNT